MVKPHKGIKGKSMANLKQVVIISAARTPIGSFGGSLSSIPAPELGAKVIKAVLEKAKISGQEINEVIMGTVLPAAQGQAPARQAALKAGLPETVECLTINKVCGSGLKSVMLAAQAIMTGDAEVVIAGGMENMSLAPYYQSGARFGLKMGHAELTDSLLKDGLWDVYGNVHMGTLADRCAREYEISRKEQDEFAQMSYRRAQEAQKKGLFKKEIVPVEIPQRKGAPVIVKDDEEPSRVNFEKIPLLKPVFGKDGTVTAANASSLNDGAAALLLMSEEKAAALNLKPLARIIAQASAAKKPEHFTIAPTDAIRKVCKKADVSLDQIDLFEINEAFAVVSLVNNRLLNLSVERVNIHGGAVAMGHPIGASGARILTTLLHAMEAADRKKGLASLCIGGGEASALIVERT